ncbi:MAG: amino acid ABC transporter permease [Clostridiales bacterium]|jgi:His/Glu/Gln/Arg/opine family amino acid ABC transporter permease subunit|nr:amino acid ABC transporter permease [Clostridiales bacterium]
MFFSKLWEGFATAFRGVPTTMGVSAVAVLIGLVLGLILALMRLSRFKVLRGLATLYIDIVRGTPLMVQALIAAYGIPVLVQSMGVQWKWPHLVIPALLCCGLNSAAYMAEIVRGGLTAVDKGQMEAAQCLGMTHRQAMHLIIIPQALRLILPPLGNEFVTMIKETAVLSVAGVTEITREGTLLSARTFDFFTAYVGVALVYLVFTITISKLVLYMEKRLKME